MKTDTLFYQLFQDLPQIFFELIGESEIDPNLYQFVSPEVKEHAFRFDGIFLPLENLPNQPIYFVEVQFQKKENFYARLFSEIFLYFYQYNPSNINWYAIIIYRRRSTEAEIHQRYQTLRENHVQCIYLDELGEITEHSLSLGLVKLVVESRKKTANFARQLITKTQTELTDTNIREKIIELIETIVVYKFPELSREELEAMLRLPEIKKTKVYQEALAEGRQEGEINAKLAIIPWLVQLGISNEEIAEKLGLEMTIIEQTKRKQN